MAEGFYIETNVTPIESQVRYLQLISLGYAAKQTRPDIAFAYGYLARQSGNVSKENAKRVLKYLKTTKSHGLNYSSQDKV